MTDALDRAQKQFDQAKAKLQRLKNKENDKKRKKDTRNKILLGGWLLAQAKIDPQSASEVRNIIQKLDKKDRAGFDIYDFLNQQAGHHE